MKDLVGTQLARNVQPRSQVQSPDLKDATRITAHRELITARYSLTWRRSGERSNAESPLTTNTTVRRSRPLNP